MSLYSGHCRIHPGQLFPERESHGEAYDDAVQHTFTAGGHHIEVVAVPSAPAIGGIAAPADPRYARA